LAGSVIQEGNIARRHATLPSRYGASALAIQPAAAAAAFSDWVCNAMIARSFFRFTLFGALAATLYLALTPGPAGAMIESGPLRHMMAFLILPCLAMAAYPRLSRWLILFIMSVFGGLIELGQLGMNVGRHGSWMDWLLDTGTAAVAIVIALAWRRISRHAQQTQNDFPPA
jgi:hypothetical protein